eukprot:4403256-Amphidinium_carterae.2
MAAGVEARAFAVLAWVVGSWCWKAKARQKAIENHWVRQGSGRGCRPRTKPVTWKRLSHVANHSIVLEQGPTQSVGTICNSASKLSSQVFVIVGCEAVLQAADGSTIMR